MQPSFFSLFKRGKYYHRVVPRLVIGKTDPESEREIKQLERFAVAAIAFCLQHDANFLDHFFDCICRINGDPALSSWNIEVEPHAWGDLIIRNRSTAGEFVYAVECKIGASLADHQNPGKDAFAKKKGYGRILSDTEGAAELRYTVLGYREPLDLSRSFPRVRIRLQQCSWAIVETGYSPSGVTLDLFNSLGHLGIPEFSYRHTNNMKIGSNATEAAKAGQVITHVCDELGFLPEYRELEPWFETQTEWCFGYILKRLPPKQGKSENQRKLMKLANSADSAQVVAWFGYEADASSGKKLSVYFYCGNRSAAKVAERWLLPKFPSTVFVEKEDARECDVIVSVTEHQMTSDREWFLLVFETLGLKRCA